MIVTYSLSANEKLLQVLIHIAASNKPLHAQQLSNETGMPISSLYRYLALLRDWNLVEENHSQNTYSAGPAALQLQRNFHTHSPLPDGVRPVLKRLQQQTGEMSAYMVPVGFNALCVDSIDSPYALRCSYEKGQSQPLIRGASAKVILAHLSLSRQLMILAHYGITDQFEIDWWMTELELIKQDGFALSTSEIDPGVSGVSAPVFIGNKVAGAVSVMAPAERINSRKNKIVMCVLQAARALPPQH
ncbi:IclR family transcriptional regulator [Photobacterium damselae subsp. piscicida]|nr:IclR family transcriptional regulator [Photobacterium damselae subsp. piscicida]MDP2531202.1 IclR family transcriptional regulator [Photobacterium damselae subsp. piscicida]MDP2546047.1 IclR family transcriptional regulator [Photobacterium damselae subsp. piscicida]MDP2556560.1 IclR family transcriptional regulator [Photobacterium damselae subsp. piscicida]